MTAAERTETYGKEWKTYESINLHKSVDKETKKRAAKPIIIQKESSLTAVYASGELTLIQKKLFNAFLYFGKQAINTDVDVTRGIKIPLSDIKRIIGYRSRNIQLLKENIKKLNSIQVEYNVLHKHPEEKWGVFAMVAGADVEKDMVVVSFPHQIINALRQPKMYFTLDLGCVELLTSKHSVSIFEILEDYKKLANFPKWTIGEFKKALDIEESKYTKITDLIKRVVNPAVEELSNKLGFRVGYILYSGILPIYQDELESYKRLPKITGLQFIKKEKTEIEIFRENIEAQRKGMLHFIGCEIDVSQNASSAKYCKITDIAYDYKENKWTVSLISKENEIVQMKYPKGFEELTSYLKSLKK